MRIHRSERLFLPDGTMHRSVVHRIHRASGIALFLDYDGTLTHIQSTPSAAVLSERARNVLTSLADNPQISVAIVTGRSLEQIRSLVGLPGIDLAANHGLQIARGCRVWTHPLARRSIVSVQEILRFLERRLSAIPDILIEEKQVTVTIHLRNVAPKYYRTIRNAVDEAMQSSRCRCRLTTGKKVLEIRPATSWSKGDAVGFLMRRQRGMKKLPIFIGDDMTDEDAFRFLQRDGITIRVGRKQDTYATYMVPSVNGVLRFLEQVPAVGRKKSGIRGPRQKHDAI